MTNEHRRGCRAALWHWQLVERPPRPPNAPWAQAPRPTAAHHHPHRPLPPRPPPSCYTRRGGGPQPKAVFTWAASGLGLFRMWFPFDLTS